MTESLLEYYQALEKLLTSLEVTLKQESRPLMEATHRILAQDITVQYDAPQFTNSAMDGYAICGLDEPTWQVIGMISAGDTADNYSLEKGEAVYILTGAPVPKGTETVIPQENIKTIVTKGSKEIETTTLPEDSGVIAAINPFKANANIRYQGEDLQKESLLLPKNTYLTSTHIALLASQGYAALPVFEPLKITLFSSGNELIEPKEILEPGKIYDANRYLLQASLQNLPVEITDGGILPDHPETTQDAIEKASETSHLILTSAGVSVGVKDYLKTVLETIGTLIHWRLAIKPGKPFAWGKIESHHSWGKIEKNLPAPCPAFCYVIMLPGNPVSSLVTFQQLALPAIKKLIGLPYEKARPKGLKFPAGFERSKTSDRREFLRASLITTPEGTSLIPQEKQGSHMLSGAIDAEVLIDVPPNTPIQKGDMLTTFILKELF